jgi:hypothetical protein
VVLGLKGSFIQTYNAQATGLKALIFIGDDQDVTSFADKARGESLPLPKLDRNKVVSSSQIVLVNLCSRVRRFTERKTLRS